MNEYFQFLLGTDKRSFTSRQSHAMPDVIAKENSINEPISIPRKFKDDIDSLQRKYGEDLKAGLCINLTLQEALFLLPRERRRVEAYESLLKYLITTWGIELNISSQKTHKN